MYRAESKNVLSPGSRFFVAEMYRDRQTETQMTDVLLHQLRLSHATPLTRQQLLPKPELPAAPLQAGAISGSIAHPIN